MDSLGRTPGIATPSRCVTAISSEQIVMTRRQALALAFTSSLPGLGAESNTKPAGGVRHQRLPDGGIQPQIVVDYRTLHLLYYSGDPRQGNVFYSRSTDGGARCRLHCRSTGRAALSPSVRFVVRRWH